MAVLILYNSNFDSAPFNELKANLDTEGVKSTIHITEGDGVFAGIEAYLSTGIIIWTAASFFKPILNGLGTDAYEILKTGIKKIYKTEGKRPTTLYGSAGKVDRSFPYSMTMSLQADSLEGRKIKFLIQKNLSVEQFGEITDIFFDFLDQYYANTLILKTSTELANAPIVGNMVLIAVDLESMEVIFPNPLSRNK